MDNKVWVINTTNGRVGIEVPELRFKRLWEKKGSKKPIDLEILKELIYDPGVEYMFKEGILFIEDMKVKQILGLEPEDAKEPENIIILSDTQKKRLLGPAPIQELKDVVKKLSKEQVKDLVDFAIINEVTNLDKCEFLKSITNIDIIKAIQLNRQDKEE